MTAASGPRQAVVPFAGVAERPAPENPVDDLDGSLLAQRYRVGELLGRGRVADVRHGHDLELDRPVALKIMRSSPGGALARRQFEAAGRLVGRLVHPNVIAVYDVGEHRDLPFLVLERLPGTTLADVLAQGTVSSDRARQIGRDLLAALGAAHAAGFTHGDLRPSDVLLATDDTAKVDFVTSRPTVLDLEDDTSPVVELTTPPSPVSAAAVGADIAAVGSTIHQAAAGSDLSAVEAGAAGARGLEPELANAVRRMLTSHPAVRPSSAGEAAELLDHPGLSSPDSTRQLEAPPGSARFSARAASPRAPAAGGRRPSRALTAGALAVGAGAVGIASLLTRSGEAERARAVADPAAQLSQLEEAVDTAAVGPAREALDGDIDVLRAALDSGDPGTTAVELDRMRRQVEDLQRAGQLDAREAGRVESVLDQMGAAARQQVEATSAAGAAGGSDGGNADGSGQSGTSTTARPSRTNAGGPGRPAGVPTTGDAPRAASGGPASTDRTATTQAQRLTGAPGRPSPAATPPAPGSPAPSAPTGTTDGPPTTTTNRPATTTTPVPATASPTTPNPTTPNPTTRPAPSPGRTPTTPAPVAPTTNAKPPVPTLPPPRPTTTTAAANRAARPTPATTPATPLVTITPPANTGRQQRPAEDDGANDRRARDGRGGEDDD